MKINIRNITILVAVLALMAGSTFAATKKELQQRFKDRYPALQEFKQQGVIGETAEGFIDFVKDRNSNAADLVDQENADRRELYQIIAKEEGVSADVVAERNAKRNFDKAKSGEYLRSKQGKWTQKP